MSLPKRLSLNTLFVVSVLVGALAHATSASASDIYLRPNEDISPISGWTSVGSSSEWDALNDAIAESETPNAGDYLTNETYEGTAHVGLQSTGLAGASSVSGTAWFYMPTTAPIKIIIREGSSPNHAIASGAFTGEGWHSVNVPLTSSQALLDNLQLEFTPVGQHAPPAPHKIYAAFIKLSLSYPKSKVYWGAWMDGEVALLEGKTKRGDAPWDTKTWEIFEQHSEKKVSIVHFGQPAPWNQSFEPKPLEGTVEESAIPMMDMDSDGVSLSVLNSGSEDGEFKKWAEKVKEYGKPFFFRWQWEMNLTSTQLGSEVSKNPKAYVEVWQRFHNIADSVGATNITWVWCPNVVFTGSTPLKSVYPGNKYVDWTCMDGYNHGTKTAESGGWKSFNNVFSETYSELTSKEFEGSSKPIMIGETASTEAGGSKPEWIAEGLGTYLPNNFPGIKAILWFNWNITEKGTEWDWPIESSAASTASFANAISSPYYAENTFKELEPLTRIQPLP